MMTFAVTHALCMENQRRYIRTIGTFRLEDRMTTIQDTCPHVTTCGNCIRATETIPTQRTGQIAWLKRFLNVPELDWVDSPKAMHYRSRIRLRIQKDGTMGYFKPKSHTLVPIDHCAIADASINRAIKSLDTVPFPAKSIEFRSNGTSVVANVLSLKGQRPTKDILQNWAEGHLDGIGLDGHKMWGNCTTTIEVCGVTHVLGLASFYQVNQGINALLVETVRDWVLEHNPSQVLDLYCGAGNIGAAIALQGVKVIGMDSAPSSIQDAKRTIQRHNLSMEVHKKDADKFQAGDAFFDVAVLDPPRKGCKGVISELQITRPKAILYVSCNPNALRNDLKEAKKHGYTPYRIKAFDMFPHTHHVETLVELRRN